MHAISSELKHLNNCSLFENLPDNFKIGHYHSWVIDNVDFSERLEITSINEDGLIMSIKHKKYNIKAVQFHPESILTEYGLELIRNWLLNYCIPCKPVFSFFRILNLLIQLALTRIVIV